MIRVRYRDSNELSPGLHAAAERHGRTTTVYLLSGLTKPQRRSALRRLRLSARMGHCPRLPAGRLALALFADRIRTGIGRAGAVLRLHPAGSTLPVMVLSGGAIAFLLFSTVSIRVLPHHAGLTRGGLEPGPGRIGRSRSGPVRRVAGRGDGPGRLRRPAGDPARPGRLLAGHRPQPGRSGRQAAAAATGGSTAADRRSGTTLSGGWRRHPSAGAVPGRRLVQGGGSSGGGSSSSSSPSQRRPRRPPRRRSPRPARRRPRPAGSACRSDRWGSA